MASRPPPPKPPSPSPGRPARRIQRGAAPTPPPKIPGAGAAAPSGVNLKRVIWTGAFAAVTFVGAIYGAGLKTRQDYRQERQRIVELPAEDRVRGLQERRDALVRERRPLEKKLGELRERMRAQEAEGDSAKK
ncbi:hypothetical protein F4819DRAFT_484935 [Hypoxylon fuscum]|nr:hypothetical protein F4819DRAFT_484935 [Hypoxylon fuscum]